MHALTKLFSIRTYLLPLIACLVVLTGCKMVLKNEITLNKDGSGTATIFAHVEYANFTDLLDEDEQTEMEGYNLSEGDLLNAYTNMINATEGATLTRNEAKDLSDDELIAADFELEFEFDKIPTLNKILARENEIAFKLNQKGKKNSLDIMPLRFSIIDKDSLEAATTEYFEFDIEYSLLLHTPAKIKSVSPEPTQRPDDKTARWDFVIDDAWYIEPVELIKVEY